MTACNSTPARLLRDVISIRLLTIVRVTSHQEARLTALDGKVERSQKTDREEFWAVADLNNPDLELRVAEWQHYYNWDRPHGSLNGQTPIEMLHTQREDTPFWDDIEVNYDPSRERFQVAHYQTDLALSRHVQARHQARTK